MGSGASTQVQPRYKWEQDHALRGPWGFLFKEKVQCACEGSKWCTRENPGRQKQPNAIPGLHSSWVGEHVLAMARPWQAHVEQYGLVAAFQTARVGMILNLQETGEHAGCGPGNLPHTGFTYDPESFMAGGVGYYNFAWRDMGVPNLDRMMDIVQVMDYVTRVEGRKVAVHCHAGLGRTGLSIACFFVFSGMYDSAEEAIQIVRQHRAGAIQTSKQVAFVSIFGQYISHLRCLFPSRGTAAGAAAAAGTEGSKYVSSSPGKDSSGGGGGGGNASPQSSPPPAKAAAVGFPTEGLLEQKSTGTAIVATYSTGLTMTVPLTHITASPGAGIGGSDATAAARGGGSLASAGDSSTLTDRDLGLESPLPWNDTFHILPQHARDFRPRAPRTYTEALARQARLLHGPERQAHLRLHKLVTEAVFSITAAAQAFQQPAQSRAFVKVASSNLEAEGAGSAGGAAALRTSGSTLPTIPEYQPPAPSGHSGTTASLSAGGAVPLPPTFAHAMALLIRSHGPAHVESGALEALAADHVYAPLTGPSVQTREVVSEVSQLREQLNRGSYAGLTRAPLLPVLMVLEAFFSNFATSSEPSSLTAECLTLVAKSYQDLFEHHVPAPPGSRRTSGAGGAGATAAVDGAGVAPGGSDASLELARQAYDILEPLQPRDSELLLVFASMMRVVARVSGPGCEEALVEVGRWTVGLLLGKLAAVPEAEEAVLSFLWYLAGRDEAFAMLVLLKRQRMAGGLRRGGGSKKGGAADVASMLQAAAVALAAAPEAPPPPPGGFGSSDECRRLPSCSGGGAGLPGELPGSPGAPSHAAAAVVSSATRVPSMTSVTSLPGWALGSQPPSSRTSAASSACGVAGGGGSVGSGIGVGRFPLPPMPPRGMDPNGIQNSIQSQSQSGYQMDPNDPHLLPAVQLAQLLSQDIQAMYRVSYKEAIAGISTVVYPPPISTGRVEVHAVWR